MASDRVVAVAEATLNLNEIFGKCGYDTNKNLLFDAIFIHMKQLATNGHSKCLKT